MWLSWSDALRKVASGKFLAQADSISMLAEDLGAT